MTRSVFVIGMVMGFGALSAACEPAPEAEVDFGGPGFDAMTGGKPGGDGPNGIPKEAWYLWKNTIASALLNPLLPSGSLSPTLISSGILDDADNTDGDLERDGQEIFAHVISCALAEGTVVSYGGKTYTGQGWVDGASVWTGQGLSLQVAGDVAECAVSFVNDTVNGLPILLTGPHINDNEQDHSEYIHGEAVWCADVFTVGGLTTIAVTAYPTARFAWGCDVNAQAALKQRYCHDPLNCGFTYGGILEQSNCVEVGTPGHGQYECNNHPCVMTWLKDPSPYWCDLPQ